VVRKIEPVAIREIIFQLNNSDAEKYAFAGFDACIDYIVRIVKEKQEGRKISFFTGSDEFGRFLINLDNKSCGVELATKLSRPGGNMVITANALGTLGVNVECAGTFGYPEILPVFRNISPNCYLTTISDTISATALEFTDSKVIMFDPGTYDTLNWAAIKEIAGTENLIQMLSGKRLIAFLNWSEITESSGIWRGFLEEILPFVKSDFKPFFFTDLSDCSRRSRTEIVEAMHLLGLFREYTKVILSLNKNEADLLGKALDINEKGSDEKYIEKLYEVTGLDIILIHRTEDALAFDGKTLERCETFFCSEPAILTGGGDNFNAGFCFALFHNLDMFQSLLLANAVAGYYVSHGTSPAKDDLLKFLGDNISLL
jgi:hypothetical protein